MNHLPDELLCSIFKYTIEEVNQLLTLQLVCKRFQRLSNNAYLWYHAFKKMYPEWAYNVNYAHDKQPLIDWKQFMIQLHKQKTFISSSQFQLKTILSKHQHRPPSFQIEEPFVSDIDPETNTGIIAVSKYCKFSRHKILFYSYPEYKLVRKFELKFKVDDIFEWSCQIVGLQTMQINNEKVRLFAISLNQPRLFDDEDDDTDDSDENNSNGRRERQTYWRNIIIYRLFDDGSTKCLANLETNTIFLGRGSWFFASSSMKDMNQWLQLVSPDAEYDPNYSVFILIYGLSAHQFEGFVQVMQFDLRANDVIADPSQTVHEWDCIEEVFVASSSPSSQQQQLIIPTVPVMHQIIHAKVVTVLYLESRVSCMVHFRYLTELNHLICTGNFHGEDLSIYDWRFGIKVGVLPRQQQQQQQQQQRRSHVQPWGLEYAFAITPPPPIFNNNALANSINYGPRLIVVGDCQDKFEIKVWDISRLLKVKWNPFDDTLVVNPDQPEPRLGFYGEWWDRKTSTLKQLAMDLYDGEIQGLPYTISPDAIKHVHLLDAPVKYTAYINLHTWLYLLHEDGHLSVMDIESGKILATVNTGGQAEDVNVVGDREIIVTRKLELLRSVLP